MIAVRRPRGNGRDTPDGGVFDDITALAARFFDVPIAIVTLVDRDRIWFASAQGLSDIRQIVKGPGLCASATMADAIYVATDLRADPEALANPLVARDSGFRFYAAAPLRTAAGHNLGTFCIIDLATRGFSDEDRKMSARFGRLVMLQMEQRLAGRRMAVQAREIASKNSQLTHAATHDVQTGLLNREAIQSRLQTLCRYAVETTMPIASEVKNFLSSSSVH